MRPSVAPSATGRLILLGGLAILVVALSGVETASGARPPFALKYEREVGPLPNDEVPHEVAPLCPKRTKVLGGGAFTVGGSPAEDVEVTSTFPDDLVAEAGSKPDGGWIGGAVNSSDSASTVGAEAICGRSVNPKYRSGTIPLPTGAVAGRQALCPAKTDATGGGVLSSGSHKDIEVVSTFPLDDGDRGAKPDDGWFGRASNDSGSAQEMTVFAICAKLPGLKYRQVTSTLPPESASFLDTVNCPGKSKVTGGGVDLIAGGLPSLDLEVAVTAPDGHDGWAGAAHNDAVSAGTMKVFAICKKKNPSP
jgi:hypothetical protein